MVEEEERAKVKVLLEKAIAETPVEERDEGFEMLGEFSEATPSMDVEQETTGDVPQEVEGIAEEIEEKPQPRGLMARG